MNKYVKGVMLFGGGLVTGAVTGSAYVGWKVLSTDEFREALAKKISNKVTEILYGDEPPVMRANRVSYRTTYLYDDVIFNSRANAEKALEDLNKIHDKFGYFTVADLYKLAGLPDSYMISDLGWQNIKNVTVIRVRDGYVLDLPRPIRIK